MAFDAGDAWLVYDGECPLCRRYACGLELAAAAGRLILVNAREGGPLAAEARALPYNLESGMALKFKGRWYLGAEALHLLAVWSDGGGWFRRWQRGLFRWRPAARLGYPLLKLGRRCLLRWRGVHGGLDDGDV